MAIATENGPAPAAPVPGRPGDALRCPLCGEPNACALAAARGEGGATGATGPGGADCAGDAGDAGGAGAAGAADAAGAERGAPRTEAPCWCVGRSFAPALLARATARDGGRACVCRRCLEAAGGR